MDQHTVQLLRRDQTRQREDRSARKTPLGLAIARNIAAMKPERVISILLAAALPVIAGATV